MLYRNVWLKIAAAGLAVVLWFWVTLSERTRPQGLRDLVLSPGISTVAARTVPVTLETEGAPPAGLRVASIELDPAVVTILGSALRVGDVRYISTSALDLSRASENFTAQLSLVVPSGIEIPNNGSRTVEVTIGVLPAQEGAPSSARP